MSAAALHPAGSRSRLAGPLLRVLARRGRRRRGRALTTTYLPVLLERIEDSPSLIGAVMTVNADRRLRRADRGRHLVRSPRPPPALHRRRGGARPPAAWWPWASATAAPMSPSRWRRRWSTSGLNALNTAHRAIVAEDVEDGRRPAATSAQELAGLVGAVVAVAIGGALIEPAPARGVRAGSRRARPRRRVPTLLVTRRLRARRARRARRDASASGRRVRTSLRRPGAREMLARPDPVGLRLRRAAGLLRSLRRGQPGPRRRRRRRAAARLRRYSPRSAWWLAGRARPERVHAAAARRRGPARRRSARRRARREPGRRRAAASPPRRSGAGLRHRARLPVLRPLRARGRGGPLQRRLLRRPRGGRRRPRCRSPAWPSS